MISSEPTLTQYDTMVVDGDCGITKKRGVKEIARRASVGSRTMLDALYPALEGYA